MKIAWFVALLGLLCAGLAACQGDLPPQSLPKPGVDPCTLPASAKYYFTVANEVDTRYFSSDTIFAGGLMGTVRLLAPPVYRSVVWQVGSDPRTYTANPFKLNFPTAVGTVRIRLVGTRPVDACRPGDRGVDTLTQLLTVVPFNYRHPHAAVEGRFAGATTAAPLDTFTVRIFTRLVPLTPSDTSNYVLNVYNLNKGCPGLDMNVIPGYRALVFNQTRGDAQCHGVYGAAAVDSTDRNILRIRYREQVTPGQPAYVDREFIGRRVR